ncbi:hypothetical protein CBR_g45724 [Chara braunii]|uniref:Uncharacterized protein n=1 Tax=Chara braunii TaxID=69332 RepID=A0A388K3T6_CHABU|nr:hypothetical protein CBR_g45724 [Chara braunii]|eukprot:GBG64669.1 hypothetical protein CBR_g45724 [Chara braunii]
MSSSKGEVKPTGTSGKESRKDSTRRSSTATQGWSNHSRSKWFIDWCCGDASNSTAQPCGPVIFIGDSRRRRVLGVVLRWEDAKGGRRHFYMQKVYGAKGNVVANSKGTLLDLELCEGFGAGAVNTPFYRELVLGGGFVLALEFFDMLEDKNIALDVPWDVNPSLELSLPLKLCSGCESSGAAAEGGDLGSGPATQVHRGESRGSQGAPQKRRGDSPDEFAGSTKKLKSKAPRTAGEKRKGTEGEQGRQVAKRPSSRQKQPESGPSSPPTTGTPIDVDAEYFLQYKDDVRTKREFDISPAQVVDLGDWEDLYNQRSLNPVLVEGIKEAMRLAFENKAQSYDLPTLKLAPLGLDKPTPGTKAERLRPEDWRDEPAGQYYYYAVCGKHNAAAARSLLGSEVARKYNFERWPARMVYFSDDDFEGYFLVSSRDNKDLKAPPRQLKLSMRDIRWQWKRVGCPRAVMGNPIGKQDQVRKWREFCNVALNMTPHNNLWILADQQGEEAIRKQGAALRSYFPLAMAGENVWKLAVEFFEKWETGRLLGHDGAKWIMRKKKVKNVKPGVGYIHNDKLGRKEVVYNIPVDPPTKKGKKEKEEGKWFVQVPEPDAHCWKTMESLTDNEKCRILKKVLACEVVWVQVGSPALAKLGKLSVQEMVNLVKCDRVLVRLWNYYQFKHDKRSDADWSQRFPFLKSRFAIFRQFESRGLDAELWDGSTKYVTDSSLFKDCPPYMGCDDDRSIEATKKLAGHKKLSVDWRNKVLSVLTGSRLKSREIALAEGIVHIKWNDTGDVTSITPFCNDPLEADIRSAEVKEAVVATKRRHVIAMEGNSELLQFTIDLVKSEVNSGAHNCEFMVVTETRARAWNNKSDMWFKLSTRKRNKIYDLLFLQTRPKRNTDAEYVRRKDHMFTLLDNYHGASRMNAKTFLERLQSLYFVESEEELMFDSYSSLISTEDEETTDIEFDATADEEGSDTESLDLQYDQHFAQHATGSSLAGLSTSPASLVSPMAKPAPGTTPMKLLQRMQSLASDHRSLRPESDIPPDHLSWTNANIHFLPEPQSRSTEADWGHDMIWHPGVIQPAIQNGSRGPDGGENEGDEAGGGKRVPGRQHEGDKAKGGSQGDTTTTEGSGGVAGEALGRQQSTGPGPECSAQSEDVPSSSACSVMAALVALRAGSVEMFKSAGIRTSMLAERTERTDAQSWLGPGVASRHPKIDSGAVRDGTSPPAGDRQPLRSEREGACGGPGDRETAKFAGIRTSPGKACVGPGDRETTKFAGIRTSSGKACGRPSDRESAKFAGIRTSSGKGGQPGILVQAGGAACGGREAHSSEIDTGSGEVAALHAGEEGRVMDKEKEVEDGDTGEELEEGGEEGEEEEDEGGEGEETELAGLLGGQEGGKGELDTGDNEWTFCDDDDRSGESSDGFGQLYGEHREEDDDDDDTALGMETQVVTSLSAERDDYEVQAMTSAVDLQHRFNEARVAVSLTKPSVRIDIEEVIDDILDDHHMSAQPSSTPGVDDPLDVKPSGGSVVDFSPTSSLMLPPTIASGGERGIGGRQDVTSPKKTAAGSRALDVLALPAPTSSIKERRDKPAGKQ